MNALGDACSAIRPCRRAARGVAGHLQLTPRRRPAIAAPRCWRDVLGHGHDAFPASALASAAQARRLATGRQAASSADAPRHPPPHAAASSRAPSWASVGHGGQRISSATRRSWRGCRRRRSAAPVRRASARRKCRRRRGRWAAAAVAPMPPTGMKLRASIGRRRARRAPSAREDRLDAGEPAGVFTHRRRRASAIAMPARRAFRLPDGARRRAPRRRPAH